MVTVGCLSQAEAVAGAVDVFLYRSDIKELNEDRLVEDIVCGDGEIFCEVEREDEFGDPKKRAGANIIGGKLYEGCFEGRTGLFAESCNHRGSDCRRV